MAQDRPPESDRRKIDPSRFRRQFAFWALTDLLASICLYRVTPVRCFQLLPDPLAQGVPLFRRASPIVEHSYGNLSLRTRKRKPPISVGGFSICLVQLRYNSTRETRSWV